MWNVDVNKMAKRRETVNRTELCVSEDDRVAGGKWKVCRSQELSKPIHTDARPVFKKQPRFSK
jgi:hypothetical protein